VSKLIEILPVNYKFICDSIPILCGKTQTGSWTLVQKKAQFTDEKIFHHSIDFFRVRLKLLLEYGREAFYDFKYRLKFYVFGQ